MKLFDATGCLYRTKMNLGLPRARLDYVPVNTQWASDSSATLAGPSPAAPGWNGGAALSYQEGKEGMADRINLSGLFLVGLMDGFIVALPLVIAGWIWPEYRYPLWALSIALGASGFMAVIFWAILSSANSTSEADMNGRDNK